MKNKKNIAFLLILKQLIDLGLEFRVSYFDFVHGTDGDSEEDYIENSKGAFILSLANMEQFEQIKAKNYKKLVFLLNNKRNFIDYINLELLPEKYQAPISNNHYEQEQARNNFFYDITRALGYKQAGVKITNNLNKDNYQNLLNLLITKKIESYLIKNKIEQKIKKPEIKINCKL